MCLCVCLFVFGVYSLEYVRIKLEGLVKTETGLNVDLVAEDALNFGRSNLEDGFFGVVSVD